jgi:hypothetical protein
MRDDPVVITLVARARDGDQHAWNETVDRYAPLVWSICKRYELSRHARVQGVVATVPVAQRCAAAWRPEGRPRTLRGTPGKVSGGASRHR